ncbi:MAG: rod shape-determining protein MreD [Rhodospirillaceae bacterium]|nr:rod shape-determining protein MreD [Rhodospirillaceae bacterium]
MSEPIQRAIDRAVRRSFPMATAAVASLAGLVTVPVADYSQIAPAFTLIAVYCWSVWRPDLLPLAGVFLIGLFEDLLRGLPLGLTALMLLTAAGFVQSQRAFVFGRSITVFWLVFGLLTIVWMAVEWMAMSILLGQVLSPEAAVFRYVATFGLLPVGAAVLFVVQRSGMQNV